MQVILIEDDAQVAGVVSLMLSTLGHTVRSFRSGTAALEFLGTDSSYDLVLTDYHLKDMTALELLPPMVSTTGVPIIVYSGSGDVGHVAETYRTRVHLLAKPFTLDQLAAVITESCCRTAGV